MFDKITCYDKINTTKEFVLNVFYGPNLLSKTLNILALINDISSITTSYNCLYQHVSLFNEFNDKFGKLDQDCWIGMFNVLLNHQY